MNCCRYVLIVIAINIDTIFQPINNGHSQLCITFAGAGYILCIGYRVAFAAERPFLFVPIKFNYIYAVSLLRINYIILYAYYLTT